MAELYLAFILTVLTAEFLLGLAVELLEIKHLAPSLPAEFAGIYDPEKYARSLDYARERAAFSCVESAFSFCVTVGFILAGGFNLVDQAARSFGFGSIVTGLIFTGILTLLALVMGLPFSIYSTFVIEERYGFNRTTPFTFTADTGKEALLTAAVGAPLLAGVIWFFESAGAYAWLYAWAGVMLFSLFVQFLAPVLILPLFNKFTPLEGGELRERIYDYAAREKFKIKGIFLMDGSKRSSKANAFFTGWGRFRRIVFYDTLLEKLDNDAVMAVLAHEMGHYKKRHLLKMGVASAAISFAVFFMLSLFIDSPGLFAAFGMEHISVYAGLLFFMFLYSPVNFLLSIGANMISRAHEYQADRYAAAAGYGEAMIRALKGLSETNMSVLTPHPLNVFLNYSHPPVLERIRAIGSGGGRG